MTTGGCEGRARQGEAFALTAAQRGIWFAQQSLGARPINIAQYVDLRGPVDLPALSRATVRAGKEIESGYLRIVEGPDLPLQVVDPTIDDGVELLDLSAEPDPQSAANEWMRADYSRPVDLFADRLSVSTLIRLGENRHLWYLRTHHIALDGFGAMALMERVTDLYNAEIDAATPKPARNASLTAIVAGERAYRESSRFEADRAYWAERTVGLPPAAGLAGAAAAPGPFSRTVARVLPPDVDAALRAAADEAGGSVAPAVVAAFAAYLGRMTDTDDVVLSLPVSARNTAKLRSAGGMVSNIVPLRLRVTAETSAAELRAVAAAELTGALRRQLYRQEDIRRDAGEGTGDAKAFGPSVNLMMFTPTIRLGAASGEVQVLTTGPIEDLSLNVYPGAGGAATRIDIEANPNLYDGPTLQAHLDRFVDFLGTVLAAGDEPVRALPVVSDDELADLLRTWNATQRRLAQPTVQDLWRARVATDPEAVAVVDGDARYTVAELDADADRVAALLTARGVRLGDAVAIAVPRSYRMIAAMYGAMKLGATYVPIDAGQPARRIEAILATSGAKVVLTGRDDDLGGDARLVLDAESLGGADRAAVDVLRRDAAPAEPLYTLFTSGSTGVPKGVVVPTGAVANQVQWVGERYGLAGSTVLQKTPATFDVSVWEIYAPAVGARLIIARPDGHLDPDYLVDVIERHQVAATSFVPSMLAAFLAEPTRGGWDRCGRCSSPVRRSRRRSPSARPRRCRTCASTTCTGPPRRRCTSPRVRRPVPSGPCRWAGPHGTPAPTCWTAGCSRCRSAASASCTSRACRWRPPTWRTRCGRPSASSRPRGAIRAIGCTAPATSRAGCRRAIWSISGGPTIR